MAEQQHQKRRTWAVFRRRGSTDEKRDEVAATAPALGEVYSAFLTHELMAERQRQNSLRDDGSRLQQSAGLSIGFLVTGLGLLANNRAEGSVAILVAYTVTAATLVAAYLCGVRAHRLMSYPVAKGKTLDKMLNQQRLDEPDKSRWVTSYLNRKTIKALRKNNKKRAEHIDRGQIFQVAGLVLLAVTFALTASGIVIPELPW